MKRIAGKHGSRTLLKKGTICPGFVHKKGDFVPGSIDIDAVLYLSTFIYPLNISTTYFLYPHLFHFLVRILLFD